MPLASLSYKSDQYGGQGYEYLPPPEVPDPNVVDIGSDILKGLWSPFSFALETLNRPGNAIRGVLAGKPEALLGLIPLVETVTGYEVPQVSGEDLLRKWGVITRPEEEELTTADVGEGLLGLGVDLITDPLVWGTGGLTKVGKAAQELRSLTAAQKITAGALRRAEGTTADVSKLVKGLEETTTRIDKLRKLVPEGAEKLATERAAINVPWGPSFGKFRWEAPKLGKYLPGIFKWGSDKVENQIAYDIAKMQGEGIKISGEKALKVSGEIGPIIEKYQVEELRGALEAGNVSGLKHKAMEPIAKELETLEENISYLEMKKNIPGESEQFYKTAEQEATYLKLRAKKLVTDRIDDALVKGEFKVSAEDMSTYLETNKNPDFLHKLSEDVAAFRTQVYRVHGIVPKKDVEHLLANPISDWIGTAESLPNSANLVKRVKRLEAVHQNKVDQLGVLLEEINTLSGGKIVDPANEVTFATRISQVYGIPMDEAKRLSKNISKYRNIVRLEEKAIRKIEDLIRNHAKKFEEGADVFAKDLSTKLRLAPELKASLRKLQPALDEFRNAYTEWTNTIKDVLAYDYGGKGRPFVSPEGKIAAKGEKFGVQVRFVDDWADAGRAGDPFTRGEFFWPYHPKFKQGYKAFKGIDPNKPVVVLHRGKMGAETELHERLHLADMGILETDPINQQARQLVSDILTKYPHTKLPKFTGKGHLNTLRTLEPLDQFIDVYEPYHSLAAIWLIASKEVKFYIRKEAPDIAKDLAQKTKQFKATFNKPTEFDLAVKALGEGKPVPEDFFNIYSEGMILNKPQPGGIQVRALDKTATGVDKTEGITANPLISRYPRKTELNLALRGHELFAAAIKARTAQGEALRSALGPEAMTLLDNVHAYGEGLLEQFKSMGIPAQKLRDNSLNYLHHNITEHGYGFMRWLKNNKARNEVIQEVKNTDISSLAGRRTLGKTIAQVNASVETRKEWLDYLKEAKLPAGTKFMETDPFVNIAKRVDSYANTQFMHSYYAGVWDSFLDTSQVVDRRTGVRLADWLAKNRYTSWVVDGKTISWELAHKAAKTEGKLGKYLPARTRNNIVKALEAQGISPEIGLSKETLGDAERIFTTFKIPEKFRRFLGFTDKIMRHYRGLSYAVWPISYSRNMMGNIWNGAVLGDAMDLGAWSFMYKLNRALANPERLAKLNYKGMSGEQWVEDLISHGTLKTKSLETAMEMQDIDANLLASANVKNTASFYHAPTVGGKRVWVGYKEGIWLENWARGAHYIAKKNQGYTSIQAAASVRKYLFNYDELSTFEKQVMKRAAFFYTWTRKNTPLMFEHIMTTPMRAWASVIGQTRTPDEEMPEWMAKSGVLAGKIAPGKFGQGALWQYIDPGLPPQETLQLNSFSKVLGLANPILKAGIEWGTGTNLFTGQPVAEQNRASGVLKGLGFLGPTTSKTGQVTGGTALGKQLGIRNVELSSGKTITEMDPRLLQLLKASPASRFTTMPLFEGANLPDTLMNLTLLKRRTVQSPRGAMSPEMRKAIERALYRGDVYKFSRYGGSTPQGKALARKVNR